MRQQFRDALSERGIDLGDEVGRGAMSVVYRATDRRHARLVAVKVLEAHPACGGNPDRLLREIRGSQVATDDVQGAQVRQRRMQRVTQAITIANSVRSRRR